MSVMTRDPDDRCASMNGVLRCVLRPHPEGRHIGLLREGDPATPLEWWDRQDRTDVTLPDAGPLIVEALHGGAPPIPPATRAVPAKPNEYTGDTCSTCQSTRMIRTGHCSTCLDCGETSGCS